MDSFDPESGQIYRETIIKQSDRPFTPWEHRCAGTKPTNVLSAQGADAMTAMVLRKLVCHARSLQPDILAAAPEHTAHQIRTAIRRENCETLHIWKTFAESGHEDKTFRHARSHIMFYKPLVNFFLDVTTTSLTWMVDLTLVDVYCSPIELRQLSTICNLQSLSVQYTKYDRGPFGDDVLKNLASRASTHGALSKLKMIFIRNARSITMKSILHLDHFPMLDTFCVVRSGITHKQAFRRETNGWRTLDSQFVSYARKQSLRTNYASKQSRLDFRTLVENYVQKRRSNVQEEGFDSPSAQICFGNNQSDLSTFIEVPDIISFERDLSFANQGRSTGAFEQLSAGVNDAVGVDRPTKKRKLKSGKAVAIEMMLDEL